MAGSKSECTMSIICTWSVGKTTGLRILSIGTVAVEDQVTQQIDLNNSAETTGSFCAKMRCWRLIGISLLFGCPVLLP